MTDQNVHDKEKENGFEKNFFHIGYTVTNLHSSKS